jgi:hypothetical protein
MAASQTTMEPTSESGVSGPPSKRSVLTPASVTWYFPAQPNEGDCTAVDPPGCTSFHRPAGADAVNTVPTDSGPR